MDHRRSENFYAVVSPGLENVCAEELTDLEMSPQQVAAGGVAFAGRLRELYRANLCLRTASRILVRFAEFHSRDFPDLFRKTLKLPWGRFIRPDTPVAFRVTCRTSRLNHTVRIAETLESSVNQALGRSTNPAGGNPQLVMVRIVDDQVVLSIDSSGELLHRRGYRQSVTAAPLRETLAAGILMLLGWHGQHPLADPMCGSGSFLFEGAMLARRQAPGLYRSYAFMHWPGFREGLWRLLCDEARLGEVEPGVLLQGADESPEAVAAAEDNLKNCAFANQVSIEQRPLATQQVQAGPGLVVCNPPYGKRLALDDSPEDYYADFGRELQRVYPGWQVALICPDPALAKATGLPFRQIATLDNGGLKVGLFTTQPGSTGSGRP
jgi:putative N6-adenine-specific DNA methylase